MSMVIQRVFNKYQSKGQIGEVSRPNQPFLLDSNGYVAGEALKPSYGVYKNGGTGKYLLPTDATTQEHVVGVIHLNRATVNTAITSPTLNNDGEVIIPLDAEFEILTEGHIYVTAGATVKKGDIALMSTDASGKWITGTPAGALTNPMVFEEDAVDGEVVSIRVNGQIAANA